MKRKESLILLFSFRLASRNVITKRNENWAWSQVTKIERDLRLLNYWAWSQVRVACEAQTHFRSSLLSRKCVCASQAKVRGFLCQANRKPRATSKCILIGSNPLTQTSGMVWKPFCTFNFVQFCTSYPFSSPEPLGPLKRLWGRECLISSYQSISIKIQEIRWRRVRLTIGAPWHCVKKFSLKCMFWS